MYKNKEKQKAYGRTWRARRRQQWLDEHGPCALCGSCSNLEVDHIDPNSKVTNNVWSWSLERRIEELSKCQVLCSVCHLSKTLEQRRKTTHGTDQMYNRYKCRCVECKAFKSKKNALRIR